MCPLSLFPASCIALKQESLLCQLVQLNLSRQEEDVGAVQREHGRGGEQESSAAGYIRAGDWQVTQAWEAEAQGQCGWAGHTLYVDRSHASTPLKPAKQRQA